MAPWRPAGCRYRQVLQPGAHPPNGSPWFVPSPPPQAAGQKWFTLAFITADQVRKVPAWAGTIGLEKQFLMDQVRADEIVWSSVHADAGPCPMHCIEAADSLKAKHVQFDIALHSPRLAGPAFCCLSATGSQRAAALHASQQSRSIHACLAPCRFGRCGCAAATSSCLLAVLRGRSWRRL